MIEVSKEYLNLLKSILIDCHEPVRDQRDWVLVDKINNEIDTLEQITKDD